MRLYDLLSFFAKSLDKLNSLLYSCTVLDRLFSFRKGVIELREWLFNARKESGMTQLDVAKRLNITEAYYAYIEHGERQKKMDLVMAANLGAIFGIPIERIVELERN